MTQVEIEYCVPCGHLNNAQDTQRELLEEFGQSLESVSLKTGDGGVFKIRVDGELVFDKAKEGYNVNKIKERVAERVEN